MVLAFTHREFIYFPSLDGRGLGEGDQIEIGFQIHIITPTQTLPRQKGEGFLGIASVAELCMDSAPEFGGISGFPLSRE